MAPPCPFFDKLPAELRNQIYELAFEPENEDAPVGLRCMKPPEKGIATACRRAWTEARQYYIDAYHRYWRNTKFYFMQNMDQHFTSQPVLYVFDTVQVDKISHLTIEQLSRYGKKTLELMDRRGVWKLSGFRYSRRTGASQPFPQMWCVVHAFGTRERHVHVYHVASKQRKDMLLKSQKAVPSVSEQIRVLQDEHFLNIRTLKVHRRT